MSDSHLRRENPAYSAALRLWPFYRPRNAPLMYAKGKEEEAQGILLPPSAGEEVRHGQKSINLWALPSSAEDDAERSASSFCTRTPASKGWR